MNNVIYTIKNIITNKYYIGRTNLFYSRKSAHFSRLKKGIHANIKLQNSFNKKGNHFIIGILEENLTHEECLKKEEYYIDLYDSIKKGYNIKLGGTREQVALGNVKYWKGKTGKNHNSSKKTYQYDLQGNFIKEWDSVKQIADFYKADTSLISACCTGKQKKSIGFYWTHIFEGKDRINYDSSIRKNTNI